MKLATLRLAGPDGADGATRAVRLDGDVLVDLGVPDVGTLLAQDGWAERAASATGTAYPVAGAAFAPVVPTPSKVVCVGLNYRNHIQEMGRDLPEHPTLFAKFADCLIGAGDPIVKPAETEKFDWEVELAVVVGKAARRVRGAEAEAAIAGFTVLNDITCRDWQFRTREWLQGKMWDSSTPVGPYLVTPDELPGGVRPSLDVILLVDGEVMQSDSTGDLLFDPVALVEYVSTVIRLNPGDLIATGTPGGVGQARTPQRFLVGGETVVTEIEGIGRLENRVVKEASA
ncbi:fumarylacetoacetate hydrolase family protein [Streptomyces odontomachi]|uniref:fumarylacetoacetate hydrolase family protein n=1 Tax=Streptomyces odontomachi TaxID=2944940 RepID=UPI00210A742F|nr:fumarylacetoacetate hydrolase family protein [Streptomyces sp. ODS25]